MKRALILIRHTKSDKNFLIEDFDRPIRKDRADDAKEMAKKLKELDVHPDLVICSPAFRTKQTAGYFCDILKYDPAKIQFEESIYEASADDLMKAVQNVDAKVKTILLVGHNPSLTYFAQMFSDTIEEIPTTGVVWLEFESKDWKINPATSCPLKYFFTPKTI